MLSIAKKTRVEGPSYKQEHEERNRMLRIYQILTNPRHSSISLVMLPEKTCIAETEHDLITLLGYALPVKEAIINKIFPKSNDPFLKSKYCIQNRNIIEIKKRFSHLKIKEMHYLKSEATGLEELEKIGNMLF